MWTPVPPLHLAWIVESKANVTCDLAAHSPDWCNQVPRKCVCSGFSVRQQRQLPSHMADASIPPSLLYRVPDWLTLHSSTFPSSSVSVNKAKVYIFNMEVGWLLGYILFGCCPQARPACCCFWCELSPAFHECQYISCQVRATHPSQRPSAPCICIHADVWRQATASDWRQPRQKCSWSPRHAS